MADLNITEIVIAIIGALGVPLLALLGKALSRWADVLSERYKLAFIARLDDQIMGYVTELFSVEVEAAKAAAKDGKLSDEEKAAFKRKAIEITKKHVGLGALANVFGSTLDAEVGARVDKAVTISQNAGKAARLPLASSAD
jgi:hypothetical protein